MRVVTIRERNEMRRLRALGWSLERAGAAVGRPLTTCRDHAGDVPCQLVRKPPPPRIDREKLLCLFEGGVTVDDLAQRFAAKRTSIKTLLCRARRERRIAQGGELHG